MRGRQGRRSDVFVMLKGLKRNHRIKPRHRARKEPPSSKTTGQRGTKNQTQRFSRRDETRQIETGVTERCIKKSEEGRASDVICRHNDLHLFMAAG